MEMNRQKQIDELVKIIKDKIDPTKIFLFGSSVSGNVDEESDIDLLIVAPSKDRPLERRLKLKKMLLEYEKTVGLDLLIYTPDEFEILINEPSSFISSVAKNGLKLYDQQAY
ncbi:MAG: nucleotidyltransferase domain-containing protein [Deltaproteobacteria bacterium]|nr:nucleotidyltransferase domain-containing protein [Deltaproteobacteria bacterium]